MSDATVAMVDTFLRVLGLALIPALVQAICLVSGSLVVLAVWRLVPERRHAMGCNCGGKKKKGGRKR